MANRPAAALALREGDRERLLRMARSSSGRAGLAQRARIVLLAADGEANTAIAERVGVSRPTVIGWRERYAERGLAGLDDEPRSGRPRVVDHRKIVAETLKPPPKRLGVTHRSSRLMAARLGVSWEGTLDDIVDLVGQRLTLQLRVMARAAADGDTTYQQMLAIGRHDDLSVALEQLDQLG